MNACKSGDKYKEGVAMGTIGATAAAAASKSTSTVMGIIGTTAAARTGLTRAKSDKGLNPMPAANA